MRFTNEPHNAIRPELVAAKVASIRNWESPALVAQVTREPRLVELLWFLQWKDVQPGGLEGFTKELLDRFPERVGTSELLEAGTDLETKWTLNKWREIYKGLPECIRNDVIGEDGWLAEAMLLSLDGDANGELETDILSRLRDVGAVRVLKSCRETAQFRMPGYFRALCNEADKEFPEPADPRGTWFFHDLTGALITMMDEHAQRMRANLADTEVSLKIFDALQYALEEKLLVRIDGESRFGKTESIETFCNMYPGLVRRVLVPHTNSDHDLAMEVAEAVGIPYTCSTNRVKLKEIVDYTVRFGGLFFIFDEAHFLVPSRFTATTPPMRLNWVRTKIVDRKLPCAIITTPQSFDSVIQRFVRKTGYTIEQFLGRTLYTVSLPAELSGEDLMLVARMHFPQMDEDLLLLIIAKALQSESYLKAVEGIAKRARYLARHGNRPAVTEKDVEDAIADIYPHLASPVTAAAPIGRRVAAGLQSRSRGPASTIPERSAMPVEDNLAGQNRLQDRGQTDTELDSALSLTNG